MKRRVARREFVKHVAISAAGYWVAAGSSIPASAAPNEKLNIAIVGTAGRGRANVAGVRETENIVALCDIDDQLLGTASEQFPRANKYSDFRRMLEQKNIDAVVVSTPDHTHATAAVAAMRLGKHVYCEKPLAHSIYEARVMQQTAAEQKVVTQMGNQGHASDRLRSAVELVMSGAIGNVREVITWSAKTDPRFSPGDRPRETPPVPPHLHWDLWLGPAPKRPYHPAYLPGAWRGWWDFGVGNFGDMACHIIDMPFWALDLGFPKSIEAEGPPPHAESAPPSLVVRYQFPARGQRPPVTLTWYDGAAAPPRKSVDGIELSNQGALLIGDKGKLLFPHSRGDIHVVREGKSVPFEFPEPTLPRPESHHQEWIHACKTGGVTSSSFAYGGQLAEIALAGVVAYRMGKKLAWDGANMAASNCPEAETLIRPRLQNGWKL